ncbi:MAG: DUF2272 domain-containing protein [Pelomonas sp.]|nr:DUF2272 domain-containing protein [Roseateles sp.]
MKLLRLLFAIACLNAAPAFAQSCADPGPVSNRAEKLVAIATGEYQQFVGHRIDAQGRIWKFGNDEVETERLSEPSPDDRYAWRRVWRYWQTLDRHQPGTLEMRRITWAQGLVDDPAQAERSRMTTLREAFAKLPKPGEPGYDAAADEIFREAVIRATISDTPWSAAFISYLMDQAGLSEQEFHYASAHAVYIKPALEQQPGYAYRACDVRHTVPRVGDLICYGRAAEPLRSYADWMAHRDELDGHVKSHCDLIVKVDRAASKLESIGGNVEQSVTWRRLMLDADGHLSTRHLVGANARSLGPNGPVCSADPGCRKSDLNQQYWGLLLQLR